MLPPPTPADADPTPPDPLLTDTFDEVAATLRRLKVWAGSPSYESITRRVNEAWTAAGRPAAELTRKNTVADCFRAGRRRLNQDLVVAVVRALHPDGDYVARWRQALHLVSERAQAPTQVRVHDRLPQDLAGFTGRAAELDRLRQALRNGRQAGNTAVISALEGMAGVGKTRLAIHAGHVLHQEAPFDRVFFVDLRGFDPDPAHPPAEPGAVLDSMLRLLGVPGRKIRRDVAGLAATYRAQLAGTRSLVILDNATDTEQVRALLPSAPGCVALVTSRRRLAGLEHATHLALDVFTPDEAREFLLDAVPGVPVGGDPRAPARIADRCGRLPLALGLIVAFIRARPGWTLTDHADRLDERHRDRRLDNGVELALDSSYHRLPADRQRLLRLVALYPGQDLDDYAAAALAGGDLATVRTGLRELCRDNVLQHASSTRYTLHDLVRAYVGGLAANDDPAAMRRAALSRLFDYYLAAAAAAMDALAPAEAHRRPRVPPAPTPVPPLADLDAARAWLDTERPNLVAAAAYTAGHGWPAHAIRLSATLARYLVGGHHADAFAIHGHAHDAAERCGDPIGQAWALAHLGGAHLRLGQYLTAVSRLRQALQLFRSAGDRAGQARAHTTLGDVEQRLGHYRAAAEHHERARDLYREVGDRTGEAHALTKLGIVEERVGRIPSAAGRHAAAVALFRRSGDRIGEAAALHNLGDTQRRLGRLQQASEHLMQALALHRQAGNKDGEAWSLDNVGALCARLGEFDRAAEHHRTAVEMHRDSGERYGEASALNGLGEALRLAGRTAEAITHLDAALSVAGDIGDRHEQARALTGLGHAERRTGNLDRAREHYRRALAIYADLGTAEARAVATHLADLRDTAATP